MGLRKVNASMNNNTLTIEQRLTRLEKAVFEGTDKPANKKPAKGFGGATGGVRFLISKSYFKKKRALAEIRSALEQHDYHYSAQAVHEALKRLIQKGGPLVSLREGGKKLYVNRK